MRLNILLKYTLNIMRVMLVPALLLSSATSWSADAVIIADMQLKPVVSVVSGINKSLQASFRVITLADSRESLREIVAEERARVVIALGREAYENASRRLPLSVPLIFGLVITPPVALRQNSAGVYMATPAGEYMYILKKYLPSLKRVGVFGSQFLLKVLLTETYGIAAPHQVESSFELVNKVCQQSGLDAILLLPDVSLMTASAQHQILLHSFRNRMPVLGVSENQVRQGALMALVFEPAAMGRQIGEMAARALAGEGIKDTLPVAPSRFDIFLNRETAHKMGITFSDDLLRRARKVYP